MIAFLTLCYVGVLAVLVTLRLLPNKPIVWMSTLVWSLLLFVVLFVPVRPAGRRMKEPDRSRMAR